MKVLTNGYQISKNKIENFFKDNFKFFKYDYKNVNDNLDFVLDQTHYIEESYLKKQREQNIIYKCGVCRTRDGYIKLMPGHYIIFRHERYYTYEFNTCNGKSDVCFEEYYPINHLKIEFSNFDIDNCYFYDENMERYTNEFIFSILDNMFDFSNFNAEKNFVTKYYLTNDEEIIEIKEKRL